MADYTSIQIIKKAQYVWVFKDNLLPTDKYWISNAYQDIINEDLVSFTTRNGANIYNNEPYSIYSYIDELDSDNDFTPTSALDFHTKLVERNFFGTNGSGGGSTPTLQGLANSLFGSLFGRGGQVVQIADNELGFTTAAIDGLFQNNVASTRTYYFDGTGAIKPSDMAEKVNNLYYLGNPNPVGITVTEIHSPVIITGIKNGTNYQFFFKRGKGIWGTTANPTNGSDFKLVSVYKTTPDDINPDDILPLGTIADGDYLAVANLTEWNFSDAGTETDTGTKEYFFSYTTDGVLYIVQFVGEPGIYGGEETPFTSDDFVATTNNGVIPASVSTVTGPTVDNTDPLNPIVGIPTFEEVISEGGDTNTSMLDNDGDGTSPYATLLSLEPHTVRRVMIQEHSDDNKRNDQASMIRLNDGRLVIAYSHFGPGAEDLDESSVYYQFSEDNGLTWSDAQELISPIALGSYIPSLYKKANGNVLLVFFVREQATPVFLSSLRSIEYSPDMTTIVTAMETILAADGYSPVGSDRLFYDENTDRLLMPYPVLISGLGSSTNSIYQTRFLISANEGDTWADSGLTFDGFLNLSSYGGAMEPGFFVNKDKITIYSRNIVGNINACDLTWTGSAYTKGTEYKLKIGAMNAQSSIKYVPLLRAWIASYTRLYDTPTSTRNQIDVSISRDATNWEKLLTVDDLLQVGGYMVNEPNILIDDKIYITYSIDKTSGTYDLKLVTIPFESLMGVDNKALNTYTANPTVSEANELALARFLLNTGFDASVFGNRVSTYVDIANDVESATPNSRSFHGFISGLYITNSGASVKSINLGNMAAASLQMILDKVHIKGLLSRMHIASFSGNSIKNNTIIDKYSVFTVEEILPGAVTSGTITDKYFFRQHGTTDKGYFAGIICIGTETPAADTKVHLVGNQRIESGNLKVIGTNFDVALNSDSLVIKNKIVTAINWSRVMSQITSNADVPYFSFGAYGLNQTFLYGYIGLGVTPHNGALIKYTSTGVGIGLPSTDTPTEKLDVNGNGKFTGDVEITDSTKGIILKSPDGTRYRVTVANGGTLTVTAV